MIELIVVRGGSDPELIQVSGVGEMDSALADILLGYPQEPTEAWVIAMRLPDGDIKGLFIDPDFARRIDREPAQP